MKSKIEAQRKVSLSDRIADKNKVPLAPEFIREIRWLATINRMGEDEIYALWREYSQECQNRDQSTAMFEFLQWNNLKGEYNEHE